MKNINLLFVFCLMIGTLNAQKLINTREATIDLFSEEQRMEFERFGSSMQDLKWIQLDRIEEAIDEEGYINFQLPDIDEPYKMKITRSEVEDENNYVYTAESQDENGEPTGDDIIFVNVGGYKSATIQIAKDFFRIVPISPETQILVKSGPETPNWCGTEGLEKQLPQPEGCQMGGDGCIIKIMYVVDSDKETKTFLSNNSIISLCKLWTEDTNTTLKNSEIKHKFQMVWVEFLTTSMPFKDKYCKLALFKKEYITNKSSPVAIARQQSEADIVIFLSARDKHFEACGIGGVANDLAPSIPEDAFALVQLSSAVTRLTVTHEVGHLLGGCHEDGKAPAKAYQFYAKGNTYNTMMHVYADDITRIKYFSNPNVKMNGVATGDKDRFNACVIQNQGCITSKLVSDDKCTLALRGAFDKDCSPSKLDLSVLISVPANCLQTGNYLFEYSTDGKTFKSACSGKSTKCTIDLSPNKKNYTIFVRLTLFTPGIPNPISLDKVYASFDVTGCK
jgi:hypothetical protein